MNISYLKNYKKYKIEITAIALAVIVVLWGLFMLFVPPNYKDTTSQFVYVQKGQGVLTIASSLKSQGLIRSERIFQLYAAALGVEKRLQAGTYKLSPSMSTVSIVDMLAKGEAESTDITITIPEGVNVWEIDKRLTAVGLIKEGEFARIALSNEGYYFPDTYRFAQGTTLAEIIGKLRGNFLGRTNNPTYTQVIIASLLEKEARKQDDMEIISGIIQNRLNRGMPLQLDASVAYGWCMRLTLQNNYAKDCDVTQAPIAAELKMDGPYNSYSRTGLPRSAISNPGSVALEAAEHPRKTDYLYYLSTRDGSQIIYAKTGAEQEANRHKYLGL